VLDVTDEVAIDGGRAKSATSMSCSTAPGSCSTAAFLDATPKDWDLGFAVNVKSMYLVSRAFIPGMLRKGRGSIINMASIASSIRGLPNRFIYARPRRVIDSPVDRRRLRKPRRSLQMPFAPARSTRVRCR